LSADPDPLAAARAWLAEDPDPKTRAELAALISAAAAGSVGAADIAERFSGRLEFGTT
jgi:phosphomannomutase